MSQVLVDTNTLMDSPEIFENLNEEIIIHSIVLEEIDNIIHNSLSDEKKYKARQARNAIKKVINKTYSVHSPVFSLPLGWDCNKNDNKLIAVCKDLGYILYTNDLAMQIKADSCGVEWVEYGTKKNDEAYTGYKTLEGATYFINELFDDISKGINKYNFVTNEYLILYNSDLDYFHEYRFDGKDLVELKLPPSKIIKALNSQQRCALDLLNNRDITVKIIVGGFGSGKTCLSVKMGLYQAVQQEYYKTLLFIRNPIVADGTDIGFLPGNKEDKIVEFCRPFLQYITSEKNQGYAEMLMKDEKIKMDVVSYLKGVNIDDSFVIMDEAEDLNIKLIKLVGSRISKNACIVFTGDTKQSENKYKHDNGLLKLIKETRGNPLVGIVMLDEDVRSDTSKIFANL